MPALLFGACQRLAGPPVVLNLMVVPLREDGHFGIERQDAGYVGRNRRYDGF
jgi:hypothetical protein